MGKGNNEKRKGRLNKTGSSSNNNNSSNGGETTFIGFGAFAATTTTAVDNSSSDAIAAGAAIVDGVNTTVPLATDNSIMKLSPIYIGTNPILSILFPKIGQKRDPITKSKALEELQDFFLLSTDTDEKNGNGTGTVTKKEKVEALNHFLYLYQTKLFYDTSSKVRALCLSICRIVSADSSSSKVGIPKAWWKNFGIHGKGGGGNNTSNTNNKNVEILGMLLCSIADPAFEVRTEATNFLQAMNNVEEEENMLLAYNRGLWRYAQRILSYTTSYEMYQDLFQKRGIHRGIMSSSSTSSTTNDAKKVDGEGDNDGGGGDNGGGENGDGENGDGKDDTTNGKKRKNSKKKANNNNNNNNNNAQQPKLSSEQKEELEERYERIVSTTLEGVRLYLLRLVSTSTSTSSSSSTSTSESTPHSEDEASMMITPASVKYLWKTMASHQPALRRQTYLLVSTICQLKNDRTASSQLQLLPSKEQVIVGEKMTKLLVQSLHSEKEATNIGILLETVLAYVVSFYPRDTTTTTTTTTTEQPQQSRSTIMQTHFFKPLCKLFKKGCHQASPARTWTPTILPFVALLASSGAATTDGEMIPPALELLTTVWEGRQRQNNKNSSSMNTVADEYDIVRAVAETSAFLLAKEEEADTATTTTLSTGSVSVSVSDFDAILGHCWMNCVRTYVSSSLSLSGAALEAHDKLGKTLAQSWLQLDRASSSSSSSSSSSNNSGRKRSKIYQLRAWFWDAPFSTVILSPTQQQGSSSTCHNQYLTKLLQEIRLLQQVDQDDQPRSMLYGTPTLRKKFIQLWEEEKKKKKVASPSSVPSSSSSSSSSGPSPPTKDVYELWIVIAQLIPVVSSSSSPSSNTNTNDNKNDTTTTTHSVEVETNTSIFPTTEQLTDFMLQHVLPWMVDHLRTRNELAVLDVTLVQLCTSFPSSGLFEKYWSRMLHDILWVKPDLGLLMQCLGYLSDEGAGRSVRELTTTTRTVVEEGEVSDTSAFSQFCIEVARNAVVVHQTSGYSPYPHDEEEEEEEEEDDDEDHDTDASDHHQYAYTYDETARFLQACVGGSSDDYSFHNEPLVGNEVVTAWIDCACLALPEDAAAAAAAAAVEEEEEEEATTTTTTTTTTTCLVHNDQHLNRTHNPVLDTLVFLITTPLDTGNKQSCSLLVEGPSQRQRVLLQCLKQGGSVWYEQTVPRLLHDDNTVERCSLITTARSELQTLVAAASVSMPASDADDDDDDNNHDQEQTTMQTVSTIWTDRASRVLQLCRDRQGDEDDRNSSLLPPLPSLRLVGLGDLSLWERGTGESENDDDEEEERRKQRQFSSLCVMKLLRHLENTEFAWALFVNSSSRSSSLLMLETTTAAAGTEKKTPPTDDSQYPLQLLVAILLTLSQGRSQHDLFSATATSDGLLAVIPVVAVDSARRRQDICASFLQELGYQTEEYFDPQMKVETILCCISTISAHLSSLQSHSQSTSTKSKVEEMRMRMRKKTTICQGIAVLSQLLQARFGKSLCPSSSSSSSSTMLSTPITTTTDVGTKLDPSDVQVGDKVWYITNANTPSEQERCVIVKIHTDLPEEVYYTIRVWTTNRENGVVGGADQQQQQQEQERQTVGERLRLVPSRPSLPPTTTTTAAPTTTSIDPDTTTWSSTIALDQVEEEEKKERVQIVEHMNLKLLQYIDTEDDEDEEDDDGNDMRRMTDSCYYELYNIVITQCGILFEERRGIGSVHYSIVQRLLKLQTSLLKCFPTKNTSSSSSTNNSDDGGTTTDSTVSTTVSTPRAPPAAPTLLVSLLWRMAYAFGFGMNVPASQWATQLVSVGGGGGLHSNTNSHSDTITMLLTILEYYNNNEEDGEEDAAPMTMTTTTTMKMDIDCAMTAWLSVSCSSLSSSMAYSSSLTGKNNSNLQNDMNRQVQHNSYSLLFQLSARLLVSNDDNKNAVQTSGGNYDDDDDNNNDGFDSHHYIALRAIEVGQLESHKSKQGASIVEDSEAEAITELVKVFSSQWKSTSSTRNITTPTTTTTYNSSSNWNTLPVFHSIMMNTLRTRPNLIAIGSRQCLNELATCLYDPQKQYYAVKILQTYAEAGRPFILQVDDANDDDDDDDLINPKTLQRLDVWAKDLLQNEADELEDDIASVAHWVCQELMNDMESWHDNKIDDDDDDDDDDDNDDRNNNHIIACGRMLSWLSILNIADAATSKDSVNRLAFTSYVSRCKAVDAMMNLAINYGNVAGSSSDHHHRNRNQKVQLDVVIPMEDILQQQQYDSSSCSSSSCNYASLSLSKLAARVIYRSVEVFPTLSKNWWDDSSSGCPTYLTQTVKEFVETQVSPDILHHAVKSVKNAMAFGEMKVMGSSVSREVTATYVQDDFTLSVVIKLPLSYPFRRAEVDCSKTLGVPMSRWKRWSLQITQMLNNQGGTIKDALLLWKDNVDKEFEGIEPCPVCYSVLHVKSHKLPNMACKTCHNHFHSDCLFEWFKSSGKSACVICQQPWSGTRI